MGWINLEYIIEEKELKKISLKFRMIASRLLNTNVDDGVSNVNRLLNYIMETTIIHDFILKNNVREYDIKKEIGRRNGRKLELPTDCREEIAFVYQLLNYISNNMKDYWGLTIGYSSSRNIQENVRAFNNEVINPFINHIIGYLEEIKIDMDIDKKAKVDINISNIKDSQVSVAQGDSSVNASYNSNSDDIEQIQELIKKILDLLRMENASSKLLEETDEILETISEEISSKKPKKSILKYCNERLSEIASITGNSATIGGSIMALIKLVEPFIS